MKPGDSLDGRYTIQDRLGAGGMGEVYRATHNFLGSTRVIKVVHPHISASDDARDRFMREARAATKIQHQNVATLHDFATLPDGSHYMVWEYIDGENLAQRLRTHGTLPPRQALHITIQALRGLDAIHRAGIIHRDISPENLMITRDDEVKIIDLGVAKVEDTDAVSQTRTGIFVGKLRYASPEQLGFIPEGEKIDGRADIYAVAMVLVELLTGRPPYEAKSPHEYYLLHAREPVTKTVELPVDLPASAALEEVLEKALARDRNQRYATAREFAAALEQIEKTLPEAANLPTMAIPLDGDATLRPSAVTTMQREQTRTPSQAAATIRTPLPSEATLRTPLPAARPPAAPTVATPIHVAALPSKRRAGINPAYLVGVIAIVVLLIAGILLWPRGEDRGPIVKYPQTTTQPSTAAPSQPPQVAEANVTVVPATETTESSGTTPSSVTAAPGITETVPATATASTATTTTTTATTTTATTAPPPVRPRPAERTPAPPAARPREAVAEAEPSDDEQRPGRSSGGGALEYVDGDDSGMNDRALERLHEELRGTKVVALRGGAAQVELVRELREYNPDLRFEPYADVVIAFDSRLERLGGGRKKRAATATVAKNGRVIFRYRLPEEVYRVGMTPTEAFARIVGDALAQE